MLGHSQTDSNVFLWCGATVGPRLRSPAATSCGGGGAAWALHALRGAVQRVEFSCLSRISSLYVNGPSWGLLCTPEAIKCPQTATCPFADSEQES